jgi:hypothetical protein
MVVVGGEVEKIVHFSGMYFLVPLEEPFFSEMCVRVHRCSCALPFFSAHDHVRAIINHKLNLNICFFSLANTSLHRHPC